SGRGGEASTVPLAADSDVAMAASSTGCPTIFIVDLEEGDVDAPTHEGPGARRSSGAARREGRACADPRPRRRAGRPASGLHVELVPHPAGAARRRGRLAR